jgi:hypothetical protein
VGVSELSAAAGVARPVLYALLARLTQRAEVVKEALPGGSAGYSLPREPSVFGPPVAAERLSEPLSVVELAVTDRAEDDTSEADEVSEPAAAAAYPRSAHAFR